MLCELFYFSSNNISLLGVVINGESAYELVY